MHNVQLQKWSLFLITFYYNTFEFSVLFSVLFTICYIYLCNTSMNNQNNINNTKLFTNKSRHLLIFWHNIYLCININYIVTSYFNLIWFFYNSTVFYYIFCDSILIRIIWLKKVTKTCIRNITLGFHFQLIKKAYNQNVQY